MAKYRTKLSEVEAFQWFPGLSMEGVIYIEGTAHLRRFGIAIGKPLIPGTWIVKKCDGLHYAIEDGDFQGFYSPINELEEPRSPLDDSGANRMHKTLQDEIQKGIDYTLSQFDDVTTVDVIGVLVTKMLYTFLDAAAVAFIPDDEEEEEDEAEVEADS